MPRGCTPAEIERVLDDVAKGQATVADALDRLWLMVGPAREIPVNQWSQHHTWPPPGLLHAYIAEAQHLGFDHCLVEREGRILIDEGAFFRWKVARRQAAQPI